MFNNLDNQVNGVKECQPSKEDELARIRKQKENIITAKKLVNQLLALPIYFNHHDIERDIERGMVLMTGELELKLISLLQHEQNILVQMDKE